MDRLRFVSLASGSSGNCYFLGNAFYGILLDAGIGSRTIKKRLKNLGIPMEQIQAVFITHDHIDHIKAVASLGEKYNIPIYTTPAIHQGIKKCYGVTQELLGSKQLIEKNQVISINDFDIEAFEVSHDATDSVGYTIYYKGKRFTYATDLGYICTSAAKHIATANFLVIESNYDEKMLENSFYPAHLKKRIMGDRGHMNNEDTAQFLAQHYHQGLQHIYLCHLSKQNNTPEKAFNAVCNHLSQNGITVGEQVALQVLDRNTPSELIIFD